MSNKVFLFSDLHFCKTSSIVRGRGKTFSNRIENCLETLSWCVSTALSNDCSAMICLGDFFDRSNLDAEEITAIGTVDFKGLPVYFIVGNHESGVVTNKNSTVHAFLQNKDCSIIDSPSIIGVGSTLLYLLPYIKSDISNEHIMDYFPDVDVDYKRVLLTHNDIKGIQMGQFVSTTGLEIKDMESNFAISINGHIHNGSAVSPTVFNIGNITGQNFSEDATRFTHNAMILDCDTLSLQIIENPHAFNFYKLDLTAENVFPDKINLKSNSVLTIHTTEKNSDIVRSFLDPSYIEYDSNLNRNTNVICARMMTKRTTETVIKDSPSTFSNIDYRNEFAVLAKEVLGCDNVVNEEILEVLK